MRSTIASIAGAERVAGLGDRSRNGRVLLVQQADELSRRAQVEVGEVGARRLGRRHLRPSRQRRAHRLPDERRVGRRRATSCARRPRSPTSRGRRTPCLARACDAASSSGMSAGRDRSSAPRAARRRRDGRPSRAAGRRSGARTAPRARPSASSTDRSRASPSPGSAATSSQSARSRACPRSRAGGRSCCGRHAPRRGRRPRAGSRRPTPRGTPHLGRQLGGNGAAEALGTVVAAARPARGVVDADVHRHHPRGLVPEHGVDAALEHPVGPLLAEVAVRSAVEAGGCDAAPVVEHLALLGMERDPAALGLAAERATESPRARLHAQPDVVRDLDDLGHRAAVVGEVVLRERVEHARVAARREVGHVPAHVPRDPHPEVRAAGPCQLIGHDQFTLSPLRRSARRRSGAGRAGRRSRPGSRSASRRPSARPSRRSGCRRRSTTARR